MEVSYRYEGLGYAIMEMSSSDWAAWVGTFGTLVAVWSAFWIYSRSRRDAVDDAVTKRRVLLAMLKQHVALAAIDIGDAVQRLTYFSKGDRGPPANLSDLAAVLQLHSQDRLFELQTQLLDSAQQRDVALAKFIEACRAYEVQRTRMGTLAPMLSGPEDLVDGMRTHLLSVALAAATEAQSLADDAIRSLEQ
jgi:hypothetical protein